MNLSFRSVIERNFELVYKIPKEVGERYEELTSFSRGRNNEFKFQKCNRKKFRISL